jgi:hypothetical protein
MADSKPGKPVHFNVFGSVMSVQWKDNEWLLFKESAAGIRIRVHDIAIPADMAQSELLKYLDDMYHEYASPDFPKVVMLD